MNNVKSKKVKWRKQQKGRMKGCANRGNTITFGEFAIQATSCGYVTNRQIEAARIAMTRKIKRGGQVWIKIFPDKVLTKKNLQKFVWVKVKESRALGSSYKTWKGYV